MQCVRLEVTHDWSAAARFKFSTSGMVTKNSARLFSASALQRRRIDFIQKGACHVIASNVFAMLEVENLNFADLRVKGIAANATQEMKGDTTSETER